MRSWLLTCIVLCGAALLWADQSPAPKGAAPAPSTTAEQQPEGPGKAAVPSGEVSDAQQGRESEKGQKPGTFTRLKRHLRNQISSGCVNAAGTHCWDKPPQEENAQQPPQQTANADKGRPPRSTDVGESSSRSTKIDLSPPPGEAAAPGVGTNGEANDVQEMKPWDPHKADKNVEVGDFYFKRGNYRAAESRYREALYWKDNDAIAMFRLAQTLERLDQFAEAQKHYAGYLSILPQGEFASEARASLDRLKDKTSQTEGAPPQR
ncbi:MAG TPA: hypothetical protein VD837_17710 [Terriglobales bacterium]|nr:hypothetical protein [Terriglobales bacterium]